MPIVPGHFVVDLDIGGNLFGPPLLASLHVGERIESEGGGGNGFGNRNAVEQFESEDAFGGLTLDSTLLAHHPLGLLALLLTRRF
jgi:hypothetical protein